MKTTDYSLLEKVITNKRRRSDLEAANERLAAEVTQLLAMLNLEQQRCAALERWCKRAYHWLRVFCRQSDVYVSAPECVKGEES